MLVTYLQCYKCVYIRLNMKKTSVDKPLLEYKSKALMQDKQ